MISYSINELYSGLKIIYNNEPCLIISNEFIKPGKGQSFNRIKLKKFLSGKFLEKTFKSSTSFEEADIIDINAIFLYQERNFLNFMNKITFDQMVIDIHMIGQNMKWLIENEEYIITLWNDHPIVVNPPLFIKVKVINVSPILKKETINTLTKSVTIVTGINIKVPLFVQVGDLIKIDTRSGEYVSRTK